MTPDPTIMARVQFFGATLSLILIHEGGVETYYIQRDTVVVGTHRSKDMAVIHFTNKATQMLSEWTEQA